MSVKARGWTGLLIALGLVLVVAALSVWRLRDADLRGWTGVVFIPNPRGKPAPVMPFRLRPGTIAVAYPGSPGERAGLRAGDEIETINGVCGCDWKQLQSLDTKVRRGDIVTYRIKRDGVRKDVAVRVASPVRSMFFLPSLIVSALVSLVFISIGSFIFWRRPDDRRVVIFFLMTIVAAIYFASHIVYVIDYGAHAFSVQPTAGVIPQTVTFGLTSLFFAPLLLHLSLIFPRPRPVVERRPEIFRWIYGPPVAVLVSVCWFFLWAYSRHWSRQAPRVVAIAGGVIALAACVRLFILMRRTGRDALRRNPLMTQLAVMAILTTAVVECTGVLSASFIVSFLAGAVMAAVILGGLLAYPICTVVALYRSYRESNVEEKRQVKWPLWAMIVTLVTRLLVSTAVSGVSVLRMAEGKMFLPPGWVQWLDTVPRLLYVLIPLSFAFAIRKYRLMNIDLIIRRTVTYGILSAIVFLLYGVLVAGVGTLLVRFAGVQNQAMIIASTIVVALVAVPLRNTLQRAVDRNVFRERVTFPLALRTLAEAPADDRQALLNLLAEQVQQALQARFALVAMRSEQHFVATAKVGVADEILGSFRVPAAGIELTRAVDAEQFSPELSQRLRRLGTALVVPLRAQREAIGFLALGAKLNDEPFSADDVGFLNSATSQVANALETSRLRGEEVEFEQARAMQQVLLPKALPRLDGFEIAGMWQPARSVGGDYYDAIALGEAKAAVCIADVAGKGMPAALIMASLQAAVKAIASPEMPPRRVCDKVRHVVADNLTGGTFITFFYALLDGRASTLTYCNAGHNPPVLVRANGEIERLDAGGSVLGRLFRSESYDEAMIELKAGDRVVLFTDGVSEARRAGEDFGDERVIDLVKANRELPAAELQEKIVEAITSFTSGNFGDDVTLVVIGAT